MTWESEYFQYIEVIPENIVTTKNSNNVKLRNATLRSPNEEFSLTV